MQLTVLLACAVILAIFIFDPVDATENGKKGGQKKTGKKTPQRQHSKKQNQQQKKGGGGGKAATGGQAAKGSVNFKNLKIRGVNRAGTEYTCPKGTGIFDGPTEVSDIAKMKDWKINAVRVPLNADCWLGVNGIKDAYGGVNYQNAIKDFVKKLRSQDFYVILDLHWTSGEHNSPKAATGQKPMPDLEYAPKFWTQVATAFKGDLKIIFDLFNEPFIDTVMGKGDAAWKCWRDGDKACTGLKFTAAGMQHLVTAVRNAGAKNLVMLAGLTWANDLSKWLDYLPVDPANNMAASWHSYAFNECNNEQCWDNTIAKVAEKYPVIAGEIGEKHCTHQYLDKLLPWMDKKGVNYLAWVWNPWPCNDEPSLTENWDGKPNGMGEGYKNHLLSVK